MIFVGRKDAYPVRYGWGAFVSSDPKSGPTVPPTRRKNLGRVTRDGFFLGFFLAVAFFLATTRRASATMTLARLDVVLFALFLDHAARWFVGARVTWAIFWALRVHASARPDVLFERARVASTLAARHPLHPLARAYPSATAAFAVARHVADALALRLALLAALLAVCPRPFAETAAHALAPTWLFVAWVERRSRTVESSPRGPTRPFPPSHEVRVWRRVVVPFETVLLVVAAVECVACGFAHDSLKYRRAVAAAASAAAARGTRLRIRAPPAWLRAYPALTAREIARRGVVAAVAPHLTLAFLLADFVDAARHSCAPRAGYATEPTAARANARSPQLSRTSPHRTRTRRLSLPVSSRHRRHRRRRVRHRGRFAIPRLPRVPGVASVPSMSRFGPVRQRRVFGVSARARFSAPRNARGSRGGGVGRDASNRVGRRVGDVDGAGDAGRARDADVVARVAARTRAVREETGANGQGGDAAEGRRRARGKEGTVARVI